MASAKPLMLDLGYALRLPGLERAFARSLAAAILVAQGFAQDDAYHESMRTAVGGV